MSVVTASTLPDYVRARRTELGLSRDQLVQRSGLSRAAVWKFEEAKNPYPRLNSLAKLAHGLEVDPHLLVILAMPSSKNA